MFHVESRRLIFYSSGHTSDATLVRLSIHDDKSHKELAGLDIPVDHYHYIAPSIDRREHATDIYIAICTNIDSSTPCELLKLTEENTGEWSFTSQEVKDSIGDSLYKNSMVLSTNKILVVLTYNYFILSD